jgi:hypothetical protein
MVAIATEFVTRRNFFMRILKQFLPAAGLLLLLVSSAFAQTTPEVNTIYYLGEVKMSGPTGRPYGSSISLVKRSILPSDNKIVEIVASIDAREVKEYTTVFEIKGSDFTVKDQEGTFSGGGKLTGPAWAWTGWSYSVDMLGERKGKLTAQDTVTPEGLVVTKSYAGADGKVQVVFNEALKPISAQMYDLLHAKLVPKVAP